MVRKTLLGLFLVTLALTLTWLAGGQQAVQAQPTPDGEPPLKLPRPPMVHPLDPLTADEIEAATAILKASGRFPDNVYFPTIALNEPPKDDVLNFSPAAPVRREAYVEVYDLPGNHVWEAIVDVRHGELLKVTERPGVQPAFFDSESQMITSTVMADTRWQTALQRRGITDFSKVYLDIWTGGDLPIPNAPAGARIMRVLSFYRGDDPNPYDRPVEGVVALVDMNSLQVIEVIDSGVRPLPTDSGSVPPEQQRPPVKPLRVDQPDGASFTLSGHEVRWQNWRFRYALHPREGLVLYTVGYEDHGRLRPILYRGSVSEIFVPYGLPDGNWAWRSAFDAGEWGLGRLVDELTPGADVPAHATLRDEVLADDVGGWWTAPNAVAIYERDGGVLWKRVDPETYEADTRLARDLVVYSSSTIGNYTYGFSWIFHQDGSLDVQVDLTGTLLLRGVVTHDEGDEYGTLVADNVSAPNHQHFFSFRLDFDVDGSSNSLMEMNAQSVPPDPRNTFGNAWEVSETMLETERAAQRDLNPLTHRVWKVINPSVTTSLGHHPGYALAPGENGVPYAAPTFPPRLAAGFVEHPLWATRYAPDQMNAAGPYPNQGRPGEGLPEWAADDGSLVNTDLVVWYTLGVTHSPEPEEYPVMNSHHTGFHLMPDGFFTRNPALDVPPLAGDAGLKAPRSRGRR